jgi:enoyl-CoA hydratase/carnithine racemase
MLTAEPPPTGTARVKRGMADMLKGGVAETPKGLGVTGFPLVIDTSTRLSRLPVVSIAKVRGRVRGIGSEFTQAMDMRFASERALFCQPETASGNLPGGGGLEHLPRLMGRARALEVALSRVRCADAVPR